jgi:hypothetical protein
LKGTFATSTKHGVKPSICWPVKGGSKTAEFALKDWQDVRRQGARLQPVASKQTAEDRHPRRRQPPDLRRGPITGTDVWGSCRYGIYARSPQRGFYSESCSGGTVA